MLSRLKQNLAHKIIITTCLTISFLSLNLLWYGHKGVQEIPGTFLFDHSILLYGLLLFLYAHVWLAQRTIISIVLLNVGYLSTLGFMLYHFVDKPLFIGAYISIALFTLTYIVHEVLLLRYSRLQA